VKYEIRKWYGVVEEIHHEGGPAPAEPLFKAAVAAVFRNPFAGTYTEDLSELTDHSPALAAELGRRVSALLGGRLVQGYGKAGIAGTAGEQEHVVACVTTVFGDALREAVGGGTAWISSATKVAAPGTTLDIPLAYKDALFVRSHYDAITIAVPDAPRHDEILIAVGASSRGRVHHRSGGLAAQDAVGDGLR
jgi:hypothetical protein